MASTLLKIKRSTSATKPQLYPGEFAYSADTSTGAGLTNGILYIGSPEVDESGFSKSVYSVAGTKFTNLLSATPGEVEAGKAVVTDEEGNIDKLKIESIEGVTKDGVTTLTIGTTGENQKVIINNPYITNEKGEVVTLDSFVDTLVKDGVLTFVEGTGIAIDHDKEKGEYTIALKAVEKDGFTPGTYGDNSHAVSVEVDEYGRVVQISHSEISTKLDLKDANNREASVNLLDGKLNVEDGIELGTTTSEDGTTTAVTTFKLDSTVVRTSGDQAIEGTKTFAATPLSTAEQALQGDDAAADNELMKVATAKEALIYTDTSENGATAEVGGVAKGKKYADTPIMQIIDDILHPYVAPSDVRLSVTENGGVFEKGTTHTLTSATIGWTAGSQHVNKVVVKEGSTELASATVAAGNTSSSMSLSKTVTDTTTISGTVYDPTASYNTNNVSYTFVYPTYHGTTTEADITSDVVTGLTKTLQTSKDSKDSNYTFTGDNARCVYAYPANYGNLSSITDDNGFNCTSTFTKSTLTIVCLDGSSVVYNVYVNAASTLSNFKFTFS